VTTSQSARELRDRVAAYVRGYQESLRFVLADERYEQAVFDARGSQTAARTMRGELFLAFIPGDGRWIAVHDIKVVDETVVTDTEDLRKLLEQGEVTPVARRVAERNARFNLGSVRRNFNEPTLPLLLFSADRATTLAVEIERARMVARAAGATAPALSVLTFRERERPTLVATERGQPLFSRGHLLVDPATGAVHRSQWTLQDGDVVVELVADYGREPRLDLLVPWRFSERYDATQDRRRELIVCEARYTNYRRFEVRGRIK
jgi:hypothetical protein